MKKLLFVFLLLSAPSYAATITAASCNQSDVRAAIDKAVLGDVVTVPPGSCSWTGNLALVKAIWLQGSGVTITVNNPNPQDLVSTTESSVGSPRVSGFTFKSGTGPNGTYGNAIVGLYPTANGRPILIDGNTFNLGGSGNSIRAQTNRGVIWNNTFTGQIGGSNGVGCYCNNASALRHKGDMAGSWTTRSYFGAEDVNGDQNLYFEGNTLQLVQEGVDVDDNARTVIRYNTFENSAIIHHGNDTSGTGARYSEIYNNAFTYNYSAGGLDLGPNVNGFIGIRGGTTLVHHNAIANPSNGAWGQKSAVVLNVEQPWRNAGPYACWNNGYPIPHQVGQGFTSTGTLEPTYFWSNTGDGNYGAPGIGGYGPDECGNNPPAPSFFIQVGRDVFLNTPKPGYTPYVYPHPLTNGTAPVPSPTPVPTPEPTPVPAPVPVDPCVVDPLKISGVKWPTSQSGNRSLSWNSGNKKIVSVAYVWTAATFKDERGCVVTVKR